ncbi:MAG: DUF2339 domain-containing protein, partial [Treponema sp.]|nr:DUF2339 domain-containing protein [Treponema sp.]
MGGLILLSILIIGAFLFSFIGVIVLLARTKRQEENIIDLRRKLNEFYKEKTHTEESIVVTELTPEEPTTSSEVITANETILPCETKLANQTTPSNEAIIVNEIVSPDETISPDLTSISVPALDIPSQKNEKKVYNAILSFIKGGNFWAVGGVLLLIAGFGLLIAYLGRRGFFTVEMGIAAAAAAGLAMILFGWRLRKKRPLYFLILQGGGIGILYLSVFAAHRLTSHFGIILSLVLMSLLIPPVIIMALFQNSEGLALLGFLGGFAAPLLLSSGNGNHLFLFSYYLVLNGGVLTIGFFRRWKGLNLLAFFLTFIPVIYWAMYKYSPALFPASQPFFVAFFLIFTILGIRNLIYKDNELKQKNKTSYSDIIVVLGTPIAAAVLQWKVFSFIEHGYAIVAVIFSAFYLGLSVFILKKAKQAMRIYAEGYLALGTLLANLVIPLELSPGLSGALWAAEGSFIFFLGLRASPWPINEKRKERGDIRIMAAGIIIHIAAAIAFIKNITIFHLEEPLPYRSPVFSGSLIIAISAIIISILAEKLSGKNKRNAITICAGIWGFAFWFTGWLYEFARVLPNPLNAFLILASLTAIVSWASAAVFNLKFLLIGMAPLSLAGFIMVLKVYFNQLSFHYTYNSYNLIFTHNFFDSLNYKGTLAFLLSQSLTILFLRPKKNTNSSLHISGDKKILQTAEAPWFRDTRIFLAIV